MKQLIHFCLILLVSCGPKTPVSETPSPAVRDPNAILTPSHDTCTLIASDLNGKYFVDLAPYVLMLSNGKATLISQTHGPMPIGGLVDVGPYCKLSLSLAGTIKQVVR